MVEIERVSKSFGKLEVLKDVSIRIEDGTIYGIIGQSGAGKSTLLRCINGLESFEEGEIRVDGVPVPKKGSEKRHLQKTMGMIFQSFNLLERLNVYDNVALPLRFWGISARKPEIREKVLHLIDLVGLSDKVHAMPRELSGGQKQRVAIARALVLDPKILLCDEATSALDPAITHGILELLQKINRELGLTIIVVTHQMEVVKQICERVTFIKEGRVIAEGKPEELFVKAGDDLKAFLQEDSSFLPETGVNIQLYFTDQSKDPVITMMARELGIDFSIVWGKLEDFRSNVYGRLIINITAEDMDRVTAYLAKMRVDWEVLSR